MPHFSPSGHDMVLCQVCGRDIDTGKEQVTWRPDITGRASAGNVCSECLGEKPMPYEETMLKHLNDIMLYAQAAKNVVGSSNGIAQLCFKKLKESVAFLDDLLENK